MWPFKAQKRLPPCPDSPHSLPNAVASTATFPSDQTLGRLKECHCSDCGLSHDSWPLVMSHDSRAALILYHWFDPAAADNSFIDLLQLQPITHSLSHNLKFSHTNSLTTYWYLYSKIMKNTIYLNSNNFPKCDPNIYILANSELQVVLVLITVLVGWS